MHISIYADMCIHVYACIYIHVYTYATYIYSSIHVYIKHTHMHAHLYVTPKIQLVPSTISVKENPWRFFVALGLNICHYSRLLSADPSGGETSNSSCNWQVILSRNAKCSLKYTKGK